MGRRKRNMPTPQHAKKEKLELLPFICGLCPSKFTHIDKFCQHFLAHNDIVTDEYFHLCDLGSYNHLESGYCPFECDACKHVFPTICQLHNHFCNIAEVGSYRIDLKNRTGIPDSRQCRTSTAVKHTLGKKHLGKCVVVLEDCVNMLDNFKVIETLPTDGDLSRKCLENSRFEIKNDVRKENVERKGKNKTRLKRPTRSSKRRMQETSNEFDEDDKNNQDYSETCKKPIEQTLDSIELVKDEQNFTEHVSHTGSDGASDNDFETEIDVKGVLGGDEAADEGSEVKDALDDQKLVISDTVDTKLEIVHISEVSKDEIEARGYKQVKQKKKKLQEWRVNPNYVRKRQIGVGRFSKCEICLCRVLKENFQKHLLSHMISGGNKENAAEVSKQSEMGMCDENSLHNSVRTHKRRKAAKLSFKEYRDSDIELEDNEETEVSQEFWSSSEEETVDEECHCDEEESFLQADQKAEEDAENDCHENSRKSLSYTADSKRKTPELADVFKNISKAARNGQRVIEFRHMDLTFKLTPQKLSLFCSWCGDRVEGSEYLDHIGKCDPESAAAFNEDFFKQFREVILRSKEVKFKKKSTNIRTKDKCIHSQSGTSAKQPNKSRIGSNNAAGAKDIDYDWDKEPERKKRIRKFRIRYQQCHICGIWMRYYSLEKHIKLHSTEAGKKKYSPENLMKCKTCKRICHISTFAIHKCFVPGMPNYREEMEEMEDTKEDNESEKEKKPKKQLTDKAICTNCGELISRARIKTHMALKHSDETPFECEECGEKFKIKEYLKTHINVQHREKTFHCDQCPSSFSAPSVLQRHYLTHTGEKNFLCTKCSKQFATKDFLKRHVMRVHEKGELPFHCQHCTRRFQTEASLEYHVKFSHLKSVEKIWLCCWPECTYKSHSAQLLRRHMCIHTGEKPLACSLCEDRFVQKQEMKAHLKKKHNFIVVPQVKEWYRLSETYRNFTYIVNPEAKKSEQRKSISFQDTSNNQYEEVENDHDRIKKFAFQCEF
ncbi:zinc finger protein 583-like isoform X2 [Mercenaria mercenaria]|uniref:zinc finger protein 583-like isoform X2 n=1 Tax=Mercenaria mercenaria TaxID=6596 RepID=UPI00234E9DAD|nr:zinc finger protein 583-like isoform X2 [Mercenaria mercenaria]